MREIFPDKRAGDFLSHEHVNDINSVVRPIASRGGSPYAITRDGSSSPLPPHIQRVVVITAEGSELESSSSNSSESLSSSRSSESSILDDEVLFECRFRYYDHAAREWYTDDEAEPHDLDAGSVNATTLQVGDVLTAYWDSQRGAFIPILTGAGGLCDPQNAIIDITLLGKPTDGEFDLIWRINTQFYDHTQTLTFPYDATATEFKNILLTHLAVINNPVDDDDEVSSESSASDNPFDGTSNDSNIKVTMGPLPNATIRVEFINDCGNRPQPIPGADWSDLEGGSGMGVIAALSQLGVVEG